MPLKRAKSSLFKFAKYLLVLYNGEQMAQCKSENFENLKNEQDNC